MKIGMNFRIMLKQRKAMNKAGLIKKVAQKSGMGIEEVTRVLNCTHEVMVEALEKRETIAIRGFGSYCINELPERVIYNPIEQRKMVIPPSLSIRFRPSPTLKNKLKSQER